MNTQNNAKSNVLDPVSVKVTNLLKDVEISAKVETVIHYLYKGKILPFTLSAAEEKELFTVLNNVLEKNEAFVIFRDFVERYGLKSSKAMEIFINAKRSVEVGINFKEAEAMTDAEELPDFMTTFTPPTPKELADDDIDSDEEIERIIKEVEEELEA